MLYLLFTPADLLKAEQLGLFDMPTQVRAHTRKDGAVVAPHIRLQKKRLHPQGGQHDLFGHAEPRTEAHKLGRLGQFVHKHGGYRRLLSILAGLPEPQRDKLYESMAEVARKPVAMVREFLVLGAKHEAPAQQGDLFVADKPQGVQERREGAGDAKGVSTSAPHIEEPVTVREAGEPNGYAIPPKPADSPTTPALPATDQPETIDHVTKKGKTIRGVIRTDLTYPQAKAIDEFTFKKDGGYFIRDKHLEALAALDRGKASGAITPEQHEEAKQALASGGPAAAMESLQKTEADKRKAQADKLRKVADGLMGKAQEAQSRDRQTNTARRARMAAGAIGDALRDEAIARTMHNIADAIEAGEANRLAGVNSRTMVELLDRILRSAMFERDRNLPYREQEKRKGRPAENADLNHVRYPAPALNIDGAKERLLRAINGQRGSVGLAAIVRRSGHYIQPDDFDKLEAAIGKDAMRNAVGWYAVEQQANAKRLIRAGIENADDLRAALAEYLDVRAGRKAEDPVKVAERALVGQKVGIDFFPTPKSLAARMAALAGIKPGMKVLEPSAGNGHLADAAREAGGDVDVVEVSDALRNVLEAKKHNLVGRDFMDMKPRSFTFGDKFRAKDGTEGIMRGSGGIGSNRVGLVNESGDPLGWYNRDELTPLEKRGTDSGYDAIVMNPPFSNGQDADHIQRAYDLLKPGGKLVAIAGEGVFFRGDKKAAGFREWLDEHGAEVEKLPEGTFQDKALAATTGANARLVAIQKPVLTGEELNGEASPHDATPSRAGDGPQEGDTKEESGRRYVLRGGRWHRIDEESTDEATGPTHGDEEQGASAGTGGTADGVSGVPSEGGAGAEPESTEPAHDPVAHAEAKQDLADELLTNPDSERAAELARKVADGFDAKKGKVRAPKPKNTLETGGDFSDDDPNSPNYRFRDTGYIGGSRKELAAQMIRQAGREGRQLRATDIDWQEIEQNPREAKELITKSNLFGAVDWDALKAGGMEPGAGFLVDRVYASLAPEPPEDSAQARRDYAVGLESLRTRLEACKTPDAVTDALNTLRDEYEGAILNAQEAADYQKAQGIYRGIADRRWALSKERDALVQAMINPGHEASALGYKQQRRLDKGWKADPALEGQIRQLKAAAEQARADLEEWDARHPEVAKGRTDSPMAQAVGQAYGVMRSIVEKAKARNREENPVHRAWKLMGPRFLGILNYRRRDGADAFREHLAAAKIGKIEDWSWAEKERKTVDAPRATKGQVRFQLQVAETFERKGGQPVKVASTAALKAMFNLRDVQSGNWVLSDPAAASFHVQKSAEALSDLADLLGVDPGQIAMNGRVALAFGARGHGSAGGMAARAHYEPIYRTINLTKLGGGGSLGHEIFHAIDNLVGEVETGQASGKDVYASEDPALLPEGELRDAMIAFRRAMLDGPHRLGEKIRYTDKDVKTARYNIDRSIARGVAGIIKAAGDIHAAVRAVDAHFAGRTDKMSEKNRKDWRKMAAAYYDAKPAGGEALVESGPSMSEFAFEAARLDGGDHGKYWSKPREMAARAFQGWCEDRLAGQGRRNDYLSSMADNRYYRLLDQRPFPEGEERERINAALDGLMAALRDTGTLAKAFGLLKAA